MSINEKIKFYREQMKDSQEDLADKLNVSRQTITKWEAGSIPQIEYLVKLSHIFGITLDMLVRDEECLKTCETQPFVTNQLVTFLVEAKKQTYAAKKGKIVSSRLASHDYSYEEGDYMYLDTYLGSEKFSGTEAVWFKDTPVYSMNYYGYVLDEQFSGDFLKEALLHTLVTFPYRGPQLYKKGKYVYHCSVLGDIHNFNGKEEIFYNELKVYELLFHGGDIK